MEQVAPLCAIRYFQYMRVNAAELELRNKKWEKQGLGLLAHALPVRQHQGAPFTSKSLSVIALGVTRVVLHGDLVPKDRIL